MLFRSALIIRLPGLFGKNIKKNFIYDYINVIPFMLKEDKMAELSAKDASLETYYNKQENGFFKLNDIGEEAKGLLKEKFRRLGFSALNFTDSRSKYQFYNLANLWNDIQTSLDENIKIWHPATEPVTAAEVYKYLTGEEFVNELGGPPADYDYRTIHSTVFGGNDGYICSREMILKEIKEFVENE